MRLPLSVLFLIAAAPVGAQATIARSTTLHAEPGSRPVAALREGTNVRVGNSRGGFTEVTLEGWVSATFVAGRREQFPISIRASSDNVRLRGEASTSSRILAEMRAGMGLTEVSRRGAWVRVRRTGWVPNAAVQATVARGTPSAPPARARNAPARTPDRTDPAPAAPAGPAAAAGDAARTARAQTSEGTIAEPPPAGQSLTPASQIALRRAPDAEAVAMLEPGARMTPTARERGWVRVQVEGWVRESEVIAADTTVRASLSAADLRADPAAAKGQLVRWDVQVLSLQTADPLRRDLERDEPYLLARGPGAENAILYLTVPPSLLETARRLAPLTHISVIARVRTGRSEPVGVPVLELQSIARVP
ncbi:MAG TPA: SH3 domain-containing protein [Gemmatimonadaceae bacterium]|nr:SH3 domain-containing protein [Gemmatimonadaceae bacterium]